MSDSARVVDCYKTPTSAIRKNRMKFYCLRRKGGESIANWLSRVQASIKCCKYPTFMIEFLLIDRFICGLINSEMPTIQLANTWSLKRIVEYFLEQDVDDSNDADERLENNSSADDAEYEEANELQIAEEMPPMSTVSEDESEVNQEFAITGIKCEFEDYEYATNESVVYETIYDANISTASFQPNLNDDETMESTQSSDIECFDCTECDEMHADQKSLDAHLRRAHNEVVIHKCPHCFTEFPEYVDLLEHFNIHTRLNRFKCRLCSRWFLYRHELPKHVNKEHNKKHHIACLDCGRTLRNNKILLAHYRTKHMKNDGKYDCYACQKSFTIPHKFTRHLQTVHQKDYLYSCQACGRSLSSYERLQSHLLTHTGERPFKCDQCTKSYTASSILAKHKRDSHSGIQ